jgi:hypothetical protein
MGSPVSTATHKSTRNEFQQKDVDRGAAKLTVVRLCTSFECSAHTDRHRVRRRLLHQLGDRSDANSGLSPDSPWQSIAQANHSVFLPGDRVLLQIGESWREQLRPPSSGTLDLPIIFSSYGVGSRPILEGDSGRVPPKMHGAPRHERQSTQAVYVAIDNNA